MKKGFTLAEVLITLGIIGVVAAITLPSLIKNYQSMVLKNQFKKAYSTVTNAVLKAQADLGGNAECYYWNDPASERMEGCTVICSQANEYGTCTGWTCEDGSDYAVPYNYSYNGKMSQCTAFVDQLFNKNLRVLKHCAGNALGHGCIPADYHGIDKVAKDNDPESNPDPGASWSTKGIQMDRGVFLVAGDLTIMTLGANGVSNPSWTVDINGNKGPNKWGYDIFGFDVVGNEKSGIMGLRPSNRATEKGGVSSTTMYATMYDK